MPTAGAGYRRAASFAEIGLVIFLPLLPVACQGGPRSLVVVLEGQGCFRVDGQPANTENLAAVVRRSVLDEKGSANPGFILSARPGTPQSAAFFQAAKPHDVPYEDFARAIIACGNTLIRRGELAGVPFRIPHADSPRAISDRKTARIADLRFLPFEIRGQADIEALSKHKNELRNLLMPINPDMEMPLSTVLKVARLLHDAGARVVFAIPYESAGDKPPRIVIQRAYVLPAGAQEDEVHLILREFTGQARNFFGIPLGAEPCKVVFISDRSGSMTDSIDLLKYALKRAIGQLTEADMFDVLFMSSGPPAEMPTRRLVNANERNKQLAFDFIDSIIPQGETDPVGSLKRAFALQPDAIFMLTDGGFYREVVDLVNRLNVGKRVKVNTICLLYKNGEPVLKEIAEQNGGTCRFVSDADLAELAR
jgi:hypothetical protein